MSLLYSSIAFNNKIVSNYYTSFESSSNVMVDTMISLSKHLSDSNNPNIFMKNNFLCGVLSISDKYHLFCFSSKDFSPNRIATFLDDTSNKLKPYVLEQNKVTIEIINEFNHILKNKIEYHNDPRNDKISVIKSHLEDTRITILDNIDLVINRGEKINELCDSSSRLLQTAETFEQDSKKLKCTMMCKNIKIMILLIIIAIILIAVILLIICTPNFSKCKKTNK